MKKRPLILVPLALALAGALPAASVRDCFTVTALIVTSSGNLKKVSSEVCSTDELRAFLGSLSGSTIIGVEVT